MKDVSRRIFIVSVLLICICGVLNYFITQKINQKKSQIEENIPITENKVDESQESVSESEFDEIETYNEKLARVNSNLNLRKSPSSEAELIETLKEKTLVQVIAKIRNGWYEISVDNKQGYVIGEYITILSDEEIKEITSEKEYNDTFAKVNIDSSLNIRQDANKSSKVLTTVKSGSVLKVFKKMQNDWYQVEGNNYTGYVSGENIAILSNEEYKSYSSSSNNLLVPSENIIAKYTSTSTYNKNSRYNMHLAADYINGTIVEPGQTYSHLSVVHPEGEENKYVASTIFVNNGQTAQASGGGICQTSSTLYAAIASAKEKGIITGFNVSAQAPHSGKVNYVPRKYEATVSSGTQDFCFRNCNEYSVKIVTNYDYNTLTITIYKI